ncbi:hypothetical protein [Candidatus Palauibacter sp.]|uniref:hypothetical protein n=1 Tax=Candidatus Palauibacter sp. TaxID=3101350 RepID=UPI003B5234BE
MRAVTGWTLDVRGLSRLYPVAVAPDVRRVRWCDGDGREREADVSGPEEAAAVLTAHGFETRRRAP